eukprot:5558723-Pleurochrysis_carterae.AAC.1
MAQVVPRVCMRGNNPSYPVGTQDIGYDLNASQVVDQQVVQLGSKRVRIRAPLLQSLAQLLPDEFPVPDCIPDTHVLPIGGRTASSAAARRPNAGRANARDLHTRGSEGEQQVAVAGASASASIGPSRSRSQRPAAAPALAEALQQQQEEDAQNDAQCDSSDEDHARDSSDEEDGVAEAGVVGDTDYGEQPPSLPAGMQTLQWDSSRTSFIHFMYLASVDGAAAVWHTGKGTR